MNNVVYKEKATVKFETTLFTEEISGIILGEMTKPTVHLKCSV
jgi:hypothetical protein